MLKKDDRCSFEEEDTILDVVCPADLLYDFQEHSTEPDDEFEDELGSEFEDELGEATISEEASEMLAQLHALGPLGFISLQRTLAQCTSSDILHTFGLSMPEGMEHAPEHARWEYVKQILIRYVYIRPRNVKVCSTVCDVVHLLRTCRNIMIVSGAGISVACGIPDFRSEGGLYEQIRERFGLPEPECMFDIAYFRRDPQPFFAFAKVSRLCICRSYFQASPSGRASATGSSGPWRNTDSCCETTRRTLTRLKGWPGSAMWSTATARLPPRHACLVSKSSRWSS